MLETLPRLVVWQPPVCVEGLVDEYVAYRDAAGYAANDHVRVWGAHAFLARYPDVVSWRTVPLEEQLGLKPAIKSFVTFLILKHYLCAPLNYLLVARPKLAQVGRRQLHAEVYDHFLEVGRRLGYSDSVLSGTLQFLFYVMAYVGKSPEKLTASDLEACDVQLRTFQAPAGKTFSYRSYSQHLYRVRMLLFHAGILPSSPQRFSPRRARSREVLWADIPAPVRTVVWRYLDQLQTMRASETVKNNEGYLRRFFTWLANADPEAIELRHVTREHIEQFKNWLRETNSATGKPYHVHTVSNTLSALRCFFVVIREWGWPEAPDRLLVFASDLPLRDKPLPRFLDDVQAAALLRAARASDDLFTRVSVETLLRTGLRKGEFVNLQMGSIVQIGEHFWLRVPLGKLHNDRYVPLHPDVKRLLDEWIAHRGDQPRSKDLFVIHGRRVSSGRVDDAVRHCANVAGISESVSPHRLRHTLATQAINRGMSLEAIAALLGHRSLTMTLVYARIASTTVREQYTAVADSLDALYGEAALEGESRPVESAHAVVGEAHV